MTNKCSHFPSEREIGAGWEINNSKTQKRTWVTEFCPYCKYYTIVYGEWEAR